MFRRMIGVTLLLGVFLPIEGRAINNSFSRKTRPNTFYGGVGFLPLITAGYKRQISPNLSLGIRRVGILLVSGGGIGLKHYYPAGCHSSVVGIHQDFLLFIDPYEGRGCGLSATSIKYGI